MLDKLVPGTGYSVSYGSTALRSLQNRHLPALDLLVRESIQNSSDAALGIDAKSLNVYFNTGVFKPAQFNTLLDDFTDLLNTVYPQEKAEFIEIRDTKTTGLTGEVKKSALNPEEHGNFFKLVFDMGKAQSQEDAGGNWGYGKSAYYRAGTGFVIFYSQVKTKAGYEQRLIITYMEDEQNPDALLKKIKPDAIGKAWWGESYDGPDGDELLPITEPELIKDILAIFNLPLFRDGQCGTSVIIPYVNSRKLLDEVLPEHSEISEEDRIMYKWADSLDAYLKLSVQKWYAPRLFNNNLDAYSGSKKLAVKVNDVAINQEAMRDFFVLVQELYTTALDYNIGSKHYVAPRWGDKISCHEVQVRNLLAKTGAGSIAVARVTASDLYGPQGGVSPHMLVRHFGDTKDPIVMFSRKLGMVIDYAIADDWTKGIVMPDSEDEMIFAFFLPNSNNTLRETLPSYAGESLEKYLRSCEKSDHMTWHDDVKIDLVARIKRNSVAQINRSGAVNETSLPEGNASRLAGKLGKRLLPGIGYGKGGKNGGGAGGNGGGGHSVDCCFEVVDYVIKGNEIELNFELQMSGGRKDAELCVHIAAESGFVDAETWENDIGTAYPVTIREVFNLNVFSPALGQIAALNPLSSMSCISMNEFSTAEIQKTEGYESSYSLKLNAQINNAKFSGCLILIAPDKKYSCSVKLK